VYCSVIVLLGSELPDIAKKSHAGGGRPVVARGAVPREDRRKVRRAHREHGDSAAAERATAGGAGVRKVKQQGRVPALRFPDSDQPEGLALLS